MSGFKASGVWPLNADIFQDSDFAPSYVTDLPDPTLEPDDVNVTDNISLNLENPELLDSVPEVDISTTEIISQIETANEPTPSCSGLQKTFSPSKIRPLPKAPPRKTNTNSRRKRKSTVLTDTPEKEALQKEYEEKMKKKQKKDDKIKGKVKGKGKGKGKAKGIEKLCLCALCLPPLIKYNVLHHFVENTNRVLESLDKCAIFGDFNLNSINWIDETGNLITTPQFMGFRIEQLLKKFIEFKGLKQYNHLVNSNNRVLGLVLSNLDKIKVWLEDVLSMIDLHHPNMLCNIPIKFAISVKYCAPKTKLIL
ncbi:unnamed protein product [Parnassius apollo]|uniref:(apollo) hypothetical protein n=1 Tax=Parnassius apollo TaxID=110799 RepID=A0A8S3XNY2_PARAO|nr:unnamed protein product [Parnassius apollo]